MNEDYIALLLQVENDYHNAIKKAVSEAEAQADLLKQRQKAYVESLRKEWHAYEKEENDKLNKTIAEDNIKIESETAVSKERLKTLQMKKAEMISERLKEEVLGLYGSS